MTVEQIIQLGFAGGIATYLVIVLVKDVKTSQAKILDALALIAIAVSVKKGKK